MRTQIKTRKLLQIGLFANILEWYEFSVYGDLSAIIGVLFFPSHSRFGALTSAFTIFSVGYLARPLGSLFFGYFSDKYGRSTSLKFSLLMMSVPTIFIGLLPTYQYIGYFGVALLIVLRLIQGFAAGGEFPVAACYIFENSPTHYRSLLCGIVSNSSIIGKLLGSLVASALFLCFEYTTIITWAWRIPFLLGIPITLWIFHIRKDIPEISITQPMDESLKNPLLTLLNKEKSNVMKGIALCAFSSTVGVYVLSFWMPFYLTHSLDYPPSIAFPINSLMLAVSIPFGLFVSWLARYIGFHLIIKFCILAMLILTYPLFNVIQGTSSTIAIFLLLLPLKLLMSSIGSVLIEALGTLFTHARSMGISISFTFPTAIFGGLTPLICTYLTKKMGLLFPAYYILFFAFLALPVALQLRSTKSLSQ